MLHLFIIIYSLFFTFPAPPGTKKINNSNIYVDENIVKNINWKEFFEFSNLDSAEAIGLIPDTTIYFKGEKYYDNEKYNFYPVVGVTINQIKAFCKWRLNFVNRLKNNINRGDCSKEYWSQFDTLKNNSEYTIKYFVPEVVVGKNRLNLKEITENDTISLFSKKFNKNVFTFRCAAKYEKINSVN